MDRISRHPSRMQLQRWFDGESVDSLHGHLDACPQCLGYLDTLSRIRSAVRVGMEADGAAAAEPTVEAPEEARRVPRPVLVALPVVVLLAAALVPVLATGGRAHVSASAGLGHRSPPASSSGRLSPRHSPTGPAPAPISGSSDGHAPARPGVGASPGIHPGSSGGAAHPGGGGTPTVAPAPLRLAVLIPTEGTEAADGTEVMQAAQKAVAEANASGGVFGARVQLDVVPAEDAPAVSALAGQVTAVTGGFDAVPPAALPWILPADPWAAGPEVVATELSPEAAGARLGQDLVQRAVTGIVGIVLGTGPDAALATGLTAEVPTTTVVASSGTCVPAIAALEQQDVEAVAIAGSPQLTSSCIAALEAAAWMPPGGILVPPSSAYAGVASAGVGTGSGVFTVLGMPWPESTSPGATRFRGDLPGITSYRALVTYAAVELAVDVARTTGGLSPSAMAGHSWRNDLYDFSGTANADVQVVEESASGWVNAP